MNSYKENSIDTFLWNKFHSNKLTLVFECLLTSIFQVRVRFVESF